MDDNWLAKNQTSPDHLVGLQNVAKVGDQYDSADTVTGYTKYGTFGEEEEKEE